MKSEEELNTLVTQLAADSTIALEEWPDVLEYMLKRLDWIAYNSFPLPKPLPILPKPPVSLSRESTVLVQPSEESETQTVPNSQAATVADNRDESSQNPVAEAAAPTVDVEATQEPTPSQEVATSVDSTQTTTIPSTQLAAQDAMLDADDNPTANGDGAGDEKFMPPALKSSLASITQDLSTTFATAPPHTVQRFAELLLKPNRHYRSLAKYLRAVNRVVAVTSGADKFPLPVRHDGTAVPNAVPLGSGLVNEHDDGATGATLTPIPWASAREYLANAGGAAAGSPISDEGVAGMVGDAEASGVGISQGELLRREQKAGLVPVSQAGGPLENGGNAPEDGPHVSGPPELGAADVGPQPEGTVFGPIGGEGEGGDRGEGGAEGGEDAKGDEMDVDEKVEEETAGEKGAAEQS
ncbi:hypothetical protein TWF696_009611 [Orbilia brochopaga]|uniref:PPP4R2-domain-containing protein n=1 Tax=Orbilia brochopaga TaxID=3140254 RepID=A0AAV9UE46_9PEZI